MNVCYERHRCVALVWYDWRYTFIENDHPDEELKLLTFKVIVICHEFLSGEREVTLERLSRLYYSLKPEGISEECRRLLRIIMMKKFKNIVGYDGDDTDDDELVITVQP